MSRKHFATRVAPPDRLRHAGEVVLTHDGLHFEAAIIRAVGPAVFETDQRRDGKRAADIGNIEPFDPLWRRRQPERLQIGRAHV